LLQEYRYADCCDARDKIFAHFGLSRLTHLNSLRLLGSEFSAVGIIPDYRMEVKELYRNLAYGIIATQGNLDTCSVLGLSPTKISSLPSWVPDWSSTEATAPILTYTRSGSEPKLYQTSRDSKPSPRLIENTLVLKGFIYDTILHVSNEHERVTEGIPELVDSAADPMSLHNLMAYLCPDWKASLSSAMLFAQ
jgi:hypothetical protein